MNVETKLIKSRLGLLGLAEELGNVSLACKYLGYSRDTFYHYKELFGEGGEAALKDINCRVPNVKNRIDPLIEKQDCYGKSPIRTWNETLYLAKNKLLNNQYQNFIPLPLSGQEETGSAGEQPVSNNLIDWNGQGGQNSPYNQNSIPRNDGLENSNRRI
ncbi:hypothetical protein EZS27_002974 [termite gut metagenome]|uniref:Uncharacterized protein n=1 Tax=termite gut metagenome TaxID=433724 RepID=A0A5J4STZ0_9ZZZZ